MRALFAISIALVAVSTAAQPLRPVAVDNFACDVLTSGAAVIVGDGGMILWRSAYGEPWQQKICPTTVRLFDVSLVDADRAVAIGDQGTLLSTSNRGVTWKAATLTAENLYDIEFGADGVGFVVGRAGTMLRTTDGGITWRSLTTETTLAITAVAVVSSSSVVAVGDSGLVLRSSDGGASWSQQRFNSSTLRAIRFSDEEHGFAAGDLPTLLATSDGGDTWRLTGEHGLMQALALRLIGDSTMFATGTGGASGSSMTHSSDGGRTWTPVASELGLGVVTDISFGDPRHAIAVGWSALVVESTDGGSNWEVTSFMFGATSTGRPGFDVAAFSDDRNVTLGGSNPNGTGALLHSSDRGVTWRSAPISFLGAVRGIHFRDADSGTAYLNRGETFFTGDGGLSWEYGGVRFLPQPKSLSEPTFVDRWVGYAVGDSVLYRTTDAGTNWQPFGTPVSGARYGLLYGLHVSSDGAMFVSDPRGAIWRSLDTGRTWSSIFARILRRQAAIWFHDSLSGVTTGDIGRVHRTSDGGVTWDTVLVDSPHFLNDVRFIDRSRGIAAGGQYTLATTDAGATWSRLLPAPGEAGYSTIDLHSVRVLPDGKTILAFGQGILRGTFGQPSGVGTDNANVVSTGRGALGVRLIPNVISRMGRSRIEFDRILSTEGSVGVQLFDISGRRVEAVASHLDGASSVPMSVDAADLTPGMYFVRVTVGDLSGGAFLLVASPRR